MHACTFFKVNTLKENHNHYLLIRSNKLQTLLKNPCSVVTVTASFFFLRLSEHLLKWWQMHGGTLKPLLYAVWKHISQDKDVLDTDGSESKSIEMRRCCQTYSSHVLLATDSGIHANYTIFNIGENTNPHVSRLKVTFNCWTPGEE